MPDEISANKPAKPKMLLHICCVGCGVYASQLLAQDYEIILFFYNPNIWPEAEHQRRLAEAEKVAQKFKLKIISQEYNHGLWLKKVKGHETDCERGERCLICYGDRLEKTAVFAQKKNYCFFSTTLTSSPHKEAAAINRLGLELAERYHLVFLAQDLKKNDGFKKSAALSRELKLYRQNYCGCEFSLRPQGLGQA